MNFRADSWPPNLSESGVLIDCVQHHVHERIDSLVSDVDACMFDETRLAPFPALLYCFSTLDMLAALAGGQAGRRVPTAALTKSYLQTYFGYSEEAVHLLQGQFRHKLVHLAQPKAVVKLDDKYVAWEVHPDANSEHCRLVPLQKAREVEFGPSLGPNWICLCTHIFRVSISQFVIDIKDSAVARGGYFENLASSAELQDKARAALKAIYEP